MFFTWQVSGYLIIPEENGCTGHWFGGDHSVAGAVCPNCVLPLTLFLALDPSDRRLNVQDIKIKHLFLFYCWRCNAALNKFAYRISQSGIEIVRCTPGGVQDGFPYANYPLYFRKCPAQLMALTESEQDTIRKLNRERCEYRDLSPSLRQFRVPRHQFAGEPYLEQGDYDRREACVLCGNRIPFIASVANEGPCGVTFHGNQFCQVLYFMCKDCMVVQSDHEVD